MCSQMLPGAPGLRPTLAGVDALQNALYRGEKEKGRKLVEAYDLECGPSAGIEKTPVYTMK